MYTLWSCNIVSLQENSSFPTDDSVESKNYFQQIFYVTRRWFYFVEKKYFIRILSDYPIKFRRAPIDDFSNKTSSEKIDNSFVGKIDGQFRRKWFTGHIIIGKNFIEMLSILPTKIFRHNFLTNILCPIFSDFKYKI